MGRTLVMVFALAAASLAGDALHAMRAYMKRGDELKAEGKLDAALEQYKKAIAIYERATAPEPEAKPAPKPQPRPKLTPEQLRARAKENIAIVRKRDATVQQRYTATVQLGDCDLADAVPVLVHVLQKDPHTLVRRAAAWSLGRHGKRATAAVPALIGKVGDGEAYVAYMAERALGNITKAVLGDPVTMGYDPTLDAKARAEVHGKWAAWWAANRKKFE